MSRRRLAFVTAVLLLMFGSMVQAVEPAAPAPEVRGQFRFATPAVRFDVSPPLRDIPVIPPPDESGDSTFFGALMVDPDPPGRKLWMGSNDFDPAVQRALNGTPTIPPPSLVFNAGTGGSNPPDPVGDVGRAHYVRMTNATFQIFNKTTGVSVFGPANINTLFVGFGGDCELENAGDPIVLYDQAADRWLLSQFSNSTGPGFFNCVAISTTSDPTGTYQRYAFPAAVFPDYPKYGIWPTATNSAYLITTRELGSNSIGVYAIDRAAVLAGSATPVVISFVNALTPTAARFLGDGLLPADVDGNTPPPAGSKAYFVGSMDNGGPYGATQDALSLWRFDINFAAPASSSFVLVGAIPIKPYDTIYPCAGRSCVPQPAPLGAVDILSYRQRPMNRAAYRNFGSYESIVTNQSVEAAPNLAGIRWWELRNPGGTPELVQDSTFAPGVTDGIHRWMGSIAQDRSGNMAMGYSASSTTVFPSVHYAGRLEGDPVDQMSQGEGVFIAAAGGNSQATRRWGDYTSMNVDPDDDCTFWYINQYFATTGTQWTLRVGSFKFPGCGDPSVGIQVTPTSRDVCTPNSTTFDIQSHAYSGFTGSASLSAAGTPPTASATFAPSSVPVPGPSTLTIGNTGAVTAGSYAIRVAAEGGTPARSVSRQVAVNVFTQAPVPPVLGSPSSGAVGTSIRPTLSWEPSVQGQAYVVEVATDAAFSNIVFTSAPSASTSVEVTTPLSFNTQHFWRARSTNVCGSGTNSVASSFTTRLGPGLCPAGDVFRTVYFDDVENGANGWTMTPTAGSTWVLSTASPFSGLTSWLSPNAVVTSDQRLLSPSISVPAGLLLPQLRFQHSVAMEPNTQNSCFDGGFVEVSTDNGATFVPMSTNRVLEDFYDGPLANGIQAWCGEAPYRQATLDLSGFAGQTIRLRFRQVTDSADGFAPRGWSIDDIRVAGCEREFSDGFEPAQTGR